MINFCIIRDTFRDQIDRFLPHKSSSFRPEGPRVEGVSHGVLLINLKLRNIFFEVLEAGVRLIGRLEIGVVILGRRRIVSEGCSNLGEGLSSLISLVWNLIFHKFICY